MTAERFLRLLVSANAGVLLLAAPCTLLPFEWMEAIHRDAIGLGSLPDIPIARYLARSLSLAYALHGAIILAVAVDWASYRPMVPLLARLHLGFGLGVLAIDLHSGMPWWWTLCEGPTIVGLAVTILVVDKRARREESKPSEEHRQGAK